MNDYIEKTLKNKKDRDFTQIENYISLNPYISRNARLLYLILNTYSMDKNECFPGFVRLCSNLQVSEFTVRECLRELAGFGLISWKRRGLGKPNLYTIEVIPQYIKDDYYEYELKLKADIKSGEAQKELDNSISKKRTRKVLGETRKIRIADAKEYAGKFA